MLISSKTARPSFSSDNSTASTNIAKESFVSAFRFEVVGKVIGQFLQLLEERHATCLGSLNRFLQQLTRDTGYLDQRDHEASGARRNNRRSTHTVAYSGQLITAGSMGMKEDTWPPGRSQGTGGEEKSPATRYQKYAPDRKWFQKKSARRPASRPHANPAYYNSYNCP